MAANDTIADGLTRLRNASRAKHPTVDLRASRMVEQILAVMKQEGFIRTYKPVGEKPSQRTLRVYLKYQQKRSVITQLVRVSKSGARVYRKASELPRVLGGLGLAIVTTSKGLMPEREAYRQRIGGEVVCYVW